MLPGCPKGCPWLSHTHASGHYHCPLPSLAVLARSPWSRGSPDTFRLRKQQQELPQRPAGTTCRRQEIRVRSLFLGDLLKMMERYQKWVSGRKKQKPKTIIQITVDLDGHRDHYWWPSVRYRQVVGRSIPESRSCKLCRVFSWDARERLP